VNYRTSILLCLFILSLLAACSSAPGRDEAPFPDGIPADLVQADALGDSSPAEDEEEAPGVLAAPDEFLAIPPPGEQLPVSSFGEIWGYLVAGRENALVPGLPLSDVAYFGAEVDAYGKLTDVPNPKNAPRFAGRLHMVVACNSRSLTHFVLVEGSAERKQLIADLLVAARGFDGLQIDFENIPARDGGAFLSFLAELRAGLKGKMFTIALHARTRPIPNDVEDYAKIKTLVDRILIMAYDEHWSTSAPGPIASMAWCKNVADYALRVIGREKLIMGIPFYGRAWGNINPSKAYVYSGIETVLSDNKVTEVRREKGIPTFDYEVPVAVKVYYEDDFSLSLRMDMYAAMGVNAVGFWRLGQETRAVWSLMRLVHAGS
jgi:spore germination protein YaaH